MEDTGSSMPSPSHSSSAAVDELPASGSSYAAAERGVGAETGTQNQDGTQVDGGAGEGGAVSGWQMAQAAGMDAEAYKAQVDAYYNQYYHQFYSMALYAKCLELSKWYTASLCPEEVREEKKEEEEEEQEKEKEEETGGNGDGNGSGCRDDQSNGQTSIEEATVSGEGGEGGEGGGVTEAGGYEECQSMDEYFEKLGEYLQKYYDGFYKAWMEEQIKAHKAQLAEERRQKLAASAPPAAYAGGLGAPVGQGDVSGGDGSGVSSEVANVAADPLTQVALFNSKNSRFSQTDSAGHWASKGLAGDRAGRQMSHYFDVDGYQEQMNQLKAAREGKGREFHAIKKKHRSAQYWRKVKEEKRKKRNAWLLKD